MEEKNVMKRLIITLVAVSMLIIIVVVVSFMLFFNKQKKVDSAPVNTGTISMTYKASANGIQLTSVQPMSDVLGKDNRVEGSYFDFTVTSSIKGTANVTYEVAVIKDKTSTIPSEYIKVYLEKQHSGTYSKVKEPTVFKASKKKSEIGSPAGSMILTKETVGEDTVDNYRLRVWVAEGAPVLDPTATFTIRVNVYGKAS